MKSRQVHEFKGIYKSTIIEKDMYVVSFRTADGSEELEVNISRSSLDAIVLDFLKRIPATPAMHEAIRSHTTYDRT